MSSMSLVAGLKQKTQSFIRFKITSWNWWTIKPDKPVFRRLRLKNSDCFYMNFKVLSTSGLVTANNHCCTTSHQYKGYNTDTQTSSKSPARKQEELFPSVKYTPQEHYRALVKCSDSLIPSSMVVVVAKKDGFWVDYQGLYDITKKL